MNRITKNILFISVLCLVSGSIFAQGDIINDVKEAIKTGSAKEIAKFFNQSVDVTLDGNRKSYSRTQAEFVLKDFFKNHSPTSFTIVHQGASKGGLPYAIGQYLSGKETYRVWVRIVDSGNKYLIDEISFIKE